MSLTVAIVAPGNMGAGVAKRLTDNGVTVITSLAGRSAASAKRATEAGMRPVEDRQLAEADFLLSIVPPGEALALARRLAPILTAANNKPVYVECNAVSPPTVLSIADDNQADRLRLRRCRHYRPAAEARLDQHQILRLRPARQRSFAVMNDYGMIVRVLDGSLTAASALKMSYAGITKGFTALGAAMMLAATRGGSAEALKAELAESQQGLNGFLTRQTPNMYAKAYRWVAELDEIAAFVGKDLPESEMFSAAARLYERIAQDFDGRERGSRGDG